MKSQLQVLKFLNQYVPKTDFDRDMIEAFIEKRYNITPTMTMFKDSYTDSTTASNMASNVLDVALFNQWYLNGYAVTEVAKCEGVLVILGNCTLNEAEILGKLEGDLVVIENLIVPVDGLEKTSKEEETLFFARLLSSLLQINPYVPKLIPKYIPCSGEKVSFYSNDFVTEGAGVVRNVKGADENFDVELYCYFVYPTKAEKSRVGFSMHENNIANLRDYVFEPLLENDDDGGSNNGNNNGGNGAKRFSSDNGISTYRRLKRELEKKGKVWKDKLLRVEPLNMRLKKGQEYWFINDKLKISKEFEKDTPTSQFRYSSGNYFTDYKMAEKVLSELIEIIHGCFAAPDCKDEESKN